MTLIKHLLFAKGVDYFAGTKEEPPDLEVLSSNCFTRTGIGVILTNELNMIQSFALVEMILKLGILFKALKKSFHEAEPLLGIFDHNLTLSFYYHYICFVPKYFDDTNLALFVAGKTDLRSNPFQVGEDDVIPKSLEHGTIQQHEPEEYLDVEHGAEEHLDKEHKDKDQLEPEDALVMPAGSMTRSRTKKLNKIIEGLLNQMRILDSKHGNKAYQTTLVLIQAWYFNKWEKCLDCTLFPLSSFVPMGFLDKVFNEAIDSLHHCPFVGPKAQGPICSMNFVAKREEE